MKTKKNKCIDCNREFVAKELNQVRGPSCEKRHGYKKVTEKKAESFTFKSSSTVKDSLKSAIFNNKIDSVSLAEALVNPEYVSYLSAVLGRDIKQEKEDTRDYKNIFISKEDIQALGLMEGGVKEDVLPGDAMRIQGIAEMGNGNNWLINKIRSAIEKKDYVSFPFSQEISSEIRAKYLLRTEPDDTFESLMSDIEKNQGTFFNTNDWNVLKKSITEATSRIQSQDIVFLSPLEEGVLGEVRPLRSEEAKLFNLNEGTIADFRKDTHDLVALKELVSAVSGEKVDHLSPFAGAFSKYLPELNKNGVRGIVFLVEGDKLKNIKLSYYNGKKVIPFGPVEAAISVADTHTLTNKYPVGVDEKYYVCVSGFIAGPTQDKYSYTELMPVNNRVIPAAETFVFQSDDADGVMATRIYFYPQNPSDLNPTYQNMSVVYGTSDQMFNSCANDASGEFSNKKYKEEMAEKIKSYGYDDEPAVKVAQNKFMPEDLPPETMSIWEEYKDLGNDVSDSILAENKYTVEKYIDVAITGDGFDKEKVEAVNRSGILKNTLPLTSRFVVYKYLTSDNGGLTKEAQITTFRRLKRYNFNEVLEDFKMGIKVVNGLRKIREAVEKGGESSVDAFDKHLDQETKDYLKNKKNK